MPEFACPGADIRLKILGYIFSILGFIILSLLNSFFKTLHITLINEQAHS